MRRLKLILSEELYHDIQEVGISACSTANVSRAVITGEGEGTYPSTNSITNPGYQQIL